MFQVKMKEIEVIYIYTVKIKVDTTSHFLELWVHIDNELHHMTLLSKLYLLLFFFFGQAISNKFNKSLVKAC